MEVGDWIILAADIVALGICIAVILRIRSLRKRESLQKKERKESQLTNDKYGSADDYLSEVTKRLKAGGFAIEENITYKNQTFDYVAKRTMCEVDKFGFCTYFYTFARFSSIDIGSLRDFSKKSFKYATKASGIPLAGGIPLPRGIFFMIICFPVAIVDAIDIDVSETIRSKGPPKHWAAAEMPVVYNLASGTLHYFEGTPMWGWLYYFQMRQTINDMLAP